MKERCVFEMPNDFCALNCRVCGRGGEQGVGLGETALPDGHAGRAILPRADRGFRAVLPEPVYLTFLLPFFPLALVPIAAKERGRSPLPRLR